MAVNYSSACAKYIDQRRHQLNFMMRLYEITSAQGQLDGVADTLCPYVPDRWTQCVMRPPHFSVSVAMNSSLEKFMCVCERTFNVLRTASS